MRNVITLEIILPGSSKVYNTQENILVDDDDKCQC